MKRFSLVALLVALALLSAVGCSSKPAAPAPSQPAPPPAPENVTITFWHTYNTDSNENKQLTQVVIPNFQKKYPNIKVESVVRPGDGLHDALVAALSSKTAPDVMRMDIVWTPEFAKLGALAPVDGLAGFDQLKGNLFPGALSTSFFKGKYYGLPLDTNTQVLVYNEEILKKAGLSGPPTKMEQMDEYLTKVHALGSDIYGLAIGGSGPWTALPWFWSLGGQVTDKEYTKAGGFLNSDASVKALQTLVDWNKKGLIGPSVTGGKPDPWGGYKSGNYAMLTDGPWFFGALGKELGDKAKGVPLPAGVGGSVSVVGGENIVMFKDSKHQDAAWKFMQYMDSDEAQTEMAKTGQMPVTRTASASDVMKQTAYYAPYIVQLNSAQPRTPSANWPKIEKLMDDNFKVALTGEKPVKTVLDDLARQIDALLSN